MGAGFTMVREVSDALVQDRLEIIEAYGVRHRCLLGTWESFTLAKSVSLDNLKPRRKSKLELLYSWAYISHCSVTYGMVHMLTKTGLRHQRRSGSRPRRKGGLYAEENPSRGYCRT